MSAVNVIISVAVPTADSTSRIPNAFEATSASNIDRANSGPLEFSATCSDMPSAYGTNRSFGIVDDLSHDEQIPSSSRLNPQSLSSSSERPMSLAYEILGAVFAL